MWSALGSEPLNAAAQWEGEGGGRGTWSIYSTCLATLILCVWTSVHMNIPQNGHGGIEKFSKVGWMLMALFAPEIVVYTAFQQRRAAMRLHNSMKILLDPLTRHPSKANQINHVGGKEKDDIDEYQPSKLGPYRAHPWTKTHSAFATMGGFAFDNSANIDDVPFPDGRTRLVLPPAGLLFLARHHPELIPDISEEAIKDKSKTDGLGKLITCVQAAYFLAQTISQLGFGLPVTLLELNTVAHSLCALSTYVLWWYKPFDVQEPAVISTSTPSVGPICAAMCLRSSLGFLKSVHRPNEIKGMFRTVYFAVLEFDFDVDEDAGSETASIEQRGDETHIEEAIDFGVQGGSVVGEKRASRDEAKLSEPFMTDHEDKLIKAESDDKSFEMTLEQASHGLIVRFTCDNTIMPFEPLRSFFNTFDTPGWSRCPDAMVTIPPETLKLCNLARQAIPHYPELKEPLISNWTYRPGGGPPKLNRGPWTSLVCDRIHDFPRPAVTGTKIWNYVVSTVGIAFANLLYAGLHLLAWNGPFRSTPEKVLWRLSATTLCLPLGVLMLATVLVPLSSSIVKLINPRFRTKHGKPFSLVNTLFETDGNESFDDNMKIVDSTMEVLFGRFDNEPFRPKNILIGIPMVILFIPWVVLYISSVLSLFWSALYSLFIGRPFVVVEGFLAVPYSPPGVYLTPDWSAYWPHFS